MDLKLFALLKSYVDKTVAGAGALQGKSAYEIAIGNGFKGGPSEWLASLKGDTPQIGPNGTWVISDVDTGVIASPSLAGYATEEFVLQQIEGIDFSKLDLSVYATKKELNEAILGIKIPDVSNYITKEELDKAILAIPVPDLTNYATKEYVQELINAIETPEGASGMMALTEEEILTICK